MQSYLLHIIDITVLTHLKTTAIEIQGIKIIKMTETRRKEHSV
jgi:hypothetical protein